MNKAALLTIAGNLIGPLLEEIWDGKYFEDIKALIVDGLRRAADLTTFTEADDVLVEHIIDALANKEYQDDVLDVIEDATEGSVLKPIVHGATAFFRTLFDIPDNDEE